MSPLAGIVPHLWIIVTEPDEAGLIVIVNVTTLRNAVDQTLILQPSDHPFLTHPSVVHFADARIVELKTIEAQAAAGTVQTKQPCSAQLLSEIQQGICGSNFTVKKVLTFCEKVLKKKK